MLGFSTSCLAYIITISLSIPLSTMTPLVVEVLRSTMSLFLSVSEGSIQVLSFTGLCSSTLITIIFTANSTFPINSTSVYNALYRDIDDESMTQVLANALSHSPAALLNASLAETFSNLSLTVSSVQGLTDPPTVAPTMNTFTSSSIAMDHALAPQSIALIVIFSIIGVCLLIGLASYCSHELSKNRRVSIEPPVNPITEERQRPAP